MRISLTLIAAFALMLAMTACDTSTVSNEKSEKLTLLEPANQSMNRGEENEVMITITRDNWDGPVAVKFSDLPSGVSIKDPGEITKGDNTRNYILVAAADADLVEEHAVMVTVSMPDGTSVSQKFMLSVGANS